MKIAIVGTGYVGLVSGTCFSEIGNDVTCIDVNTDKIIKLEHGEIPIYEPGLQEMVTRNVKEGRLHFTTDYSVVGDAEIYFIAVGTPPMEDGSADVSYVLDAAKTIAKTRTSTENFIVVDKSTVPVGTAEKVSAAIFMGLRTKSKYAVSDFEYAVVSNPEFLKEGKAIDDFMRPDRVVIGSDTDWATQKMKELYEKFTLNGNPIVITNVKSAELIKYASNAMLATRISFVNELSRLCEKIGANIKDVSKGMGLDSRIGSKFLHASCGYGGSCFPKDVKALIHTGQENGVDMEIISAVEHVNEIQKFEIVNKITSHFETTNLKGKTFSIWGLAFKPDTDDMREATSLVVIRELIKMGAKIKAYDPEAMEVSKLYLKDCEDYITYCNSKYDAAKDSDALVLLTEWRAFTMPDWEELRNIMKSRVLFDGRNIWDKSHPNTFEYFGIGVN